MGFIDVSRGLTSDTNLASGTGNGGNNATNLNDAIANRSHQGLFFFPGGRWDFDDTITTAQRAGQSLVGAGFTRNLAESQYSSGVGGVATRLAWMGDDSSPQIKVRGWGCLLDGFTLQGLPESGSDRALVGIHYDCNSSPGTSQLRIGRVGLDGHTYGMLLGTNTTDTPSGPGGDYASDGDLHADNAVGDQLWLRGCQTAGIWARTTQAVALDFNFVHVTGMSSSTPIFWMERGGGLKVNFIEIASNCTVLKIGKSNSNSGHYHIAGFRVDASVAANWGMLTFDNSFTGYNTAHATVVIENGIIANVASATYFIDTGAAGDGRSCSIIVRNVTGIRNGSIRLNGFQSGGSEPTRHVANLFFDNCTFYGCDTPADALDASTTLYHCSWTDCLDAGFTSGATGYVGIPFPDGYITSSSLPLHTAGPTPNAQVTPAAETGAATISIADIQSGIVTLTQSSGADVALTLDTGTNMDAGCELGLNQCYDWTLINLSAAAADTGTVTAASGHTLVGVGLVPSSHSSTGGSDGSSSARFRSRRTAAATWITYRIG